MTERELLHEFATLIGTAIDANESNTVCVYREGVLFHQVLLTQAWIDRAKELERTYQPTTVTGCPKS